MQGHRTRRVSRRGDGKRVGQKLVKNRFTVTGVIVNGVGYGLATNKKLKPISVMIGK